MTVHEFDPARAGDHDAHDWWPYFYRSAFADYVNHDIVTDRKLQRCGVDHRVRLSGGAELLVDVKCRCTAKAMHNDFLIEVWSDFEKRIPGWARKPLHCQYIAYVWPQADVGFLVPFHLLQLAYEQQKYTYKADGMRVIDARNRNYTTRNVAVPIDRLLTDVAGAMQVKFTDEGRPF